MSELKPCPFCGRESRVGKTSYNCTLENLRKTYPDKNQTHGYFVSCMYCGGSMKAVSFYDTEEEAIQAWNTRPDSVEQESQQSEWVSESDAIRMIRFAYDKGIDWTNRHRTKNCMSVDDVVHHLVPQKG